MFYRLIFSTIIVREKIGRAIELVQAVKIKATRVTLNRLKLRRKQLFQLMLMAVPRATAFSICCQAISAVCVQYI